eukprot:12200723-Karenia_brevis.AAC.1
MSANPDKQIYVAIFVSEESVMIVQDHVVGVEMNLVSYVNFYTCILVRRDRRFAGAKEKSNHLW